MNDSHASPADRLAPESLDGDGAGDHDLAFTGFRPYHFNTREMVRLLVLRGRILDARLGEGALADDLE
jgi:hypothetical protein